MLTSLLVTDIGILLRTNSLEYGSTLIILVDFKWMSDDKFPGLMK
ncbi:MAG TPA: hypothetical protein VK711_16110 [Puia sp.]|jgi:hypothetical protein|nr:hypothetical protein [Puia sp.]